jgi:hypothetical protein
MWPYYFCSSSLSASRAALAISILEIFYAFQHKISSIRSTNCYRLNTSCNRQLYLGKINEKHNMCIGRNGRPNNRACQPGSSSGTAIVLLLGLLVAIPAFVD